MPVPRAVRVASFAALSIVGGVALCHGPAARAAAQQADRVRAIEVTASRFAFDPSTIEVGVGERVRLVLKSADGVHGIEIKKFDVKKEIPRGGEPVTVEFTAKAAGSFPILCSEYCGNGHEDMRGTLVVRAVDGGEPHESR